jgi:hypothetical protein
MRFDFPIKILAPGEHLLVPMKLVLGSFGNIDFGLHPESVPSRIAATTLPDVNFEDGKVVSIFSPEKTRANNFYNEYIVGSWFEPLSVDSLGSLRPFLRSNVIYHGPLEMGSCPYAFVSTSNRNNWKVAGRLIPDRVGKKLEGRSKLPFKYPADGKVLIKEMENEESFLDQIYLELQTVDGRTVTLFPDNRLLRNKDFDYLTLRRGDHVLISFPAISFEVKRAYLVSEGYFVFEETQFDSRHVGRVDSNQDNRH